MPLPDVPPTDFEFAIFKWLAVPLVLIAVVALLVNTSSQSRQCKKACHAEGYAKHRYQPSGRYGVPAAACYCLTAEEAKIKNRIIKGRQINL